MIYTVDSYSAEIVSGNNQVVTVGKIIPIPLEVRVTFKNKSSSGDPQPVAGVIVNFNVPQKGVYSVDPEYVELMGSGQPVKAEERNQFVRTTNSSGYASLSNIFFSNPCQFNIFVEVSDYSPLESSPDILSSFDLEAESDEGGVVPQLLPLPSLSRSVYSSLSKFFFLVSVSRFSLE